MKKVIGLIIGVAAVVGLVASGTWALFTDTETSTGNTVCAGTIDISLNPDGGQTATTVEGNMDLKPCQTGYITVAVTNDGTNPAEIWKRITNVVNSENGIPDAEQDYYTANPNSMGWLLSDWIHYDMSTGCGGPLVDGYTTPATSVSTTAPNQSDNGVVITVEDTDTAVKWTFDFPIEGVSGNGHIAYDLVVSSPASDDPTFIVFNNDGVNPGYVYGTHLYSEWSSSGGGWNGWHTSDPTSVTPVANMDWIQATGDRDIVNNPNGIFTVTIDKCALGGCFSWGAHFGSGGFFSPYGGQSQWPESDDWSIFAGTGEATNFEGICQTGTVLIGENDGFFLTDGGTNPNNNSPVAGSYIYLGVLEPDESMTIVQSYHLDYDVDNWGQSDLVTFDIEFIAQQTESNPPPPGTELPGHGRAN